MSKNQGMNITGIRVFGIEHAILGMRYPLNSEKNSDTFLDNDGFVVVGPKDLDLLIRLSKAGTDHRKVLRMINVYASVKMPFTWWAHYDTYKVGTTAISRSRMHKLTERLLRRDDFYVEEWDDSNKMVMDNINNHIDQALTFKEVQEPKNAKYHWRKALDALPMTYCQERMINLNYEVLLNILGSRYKVEKLAPEWDFFCQHFIDNCMHLEEIYDAVKHKRSLTTGEFNAKSKEK